MQALEVLKSDLRTCRFRGWSMSRSIWPWAPCQLTGAIFRSPSCKPFMSAIFSGKDAIFSCKDNILDLSWSCETLRLRGGRLSCGLVYPALLCSASIGEEGRWSPRWRSPARNCAWISMGGGEWDLWSEVGLYSPGEVCGLLGEVSSAELGLGDCGILKKIK